MFTLSEEGVVLSEIAPGVDLKKDILDQMGFQPIIPEHGPQLMDSRIFKPRPMELIYDMFPK